MEQYVTILMCLILLAGMMGCTSLLGGSDGAPTTAETQTEDIDKGSGDASTPSSPADGEPHPMAPPPPIPTRRAFSVDECSNAIVDGNCPENCDIIDDIDCCMTEQPGPDGKCPEGWKLVEDQFCFDIAMCDMTYPGFG